MTKKTAIETEIQGKKRVRGAIPEDQSVERKKIRFGEKKSEPFCSWSPKIFSDPLPSSEVAPSECSNSPSKLNFYISDSSTKATTRHIITPTPSSLSLEGELGPIAAPTKRLPRVLDVIKETAERKPDVLSNRRIGEVMIIQVFDIPDGNSEKNSVEEVAQDVVQSSESSSLAAKEKKTLRLSPWFRRLVLLLVALIMAVGMLSGTARRPVAPNSVYVPGGGFSGFWYTLGRLRSIHDPTIKKFYCYSAGCLGAVTALSNYTMENVLGMAREAQEQWLRGDIARHDVVGFFLDELLVDTPMNDPLLLSKLHIITTRRIGWLGVTAEIRTPATVESLRTMLLQTTWIPFAVGNGLWHEDHMDGAFSLWQHPTCAFDVGLTFNVGLLANVININLSEEQVHELYKLGLAHGLS